MNDAVRSLERQRLVEALEQADGNLSRAAALLGIPRNTLRYRLQRHELRPEGAKKPVSRERAPTVAPAPAPASAPVPLASLRWERRHLAFLGATLTLPAGEEPPPEASRALEVMIDKVQGFGGRLEEMGPTGLVAAFGIEPTEDPARLAALAAMAIAKAAERARRNESGGAAGARLALHVQPALVGAVGGTVVIDAASKATTSATLQELLQRAAPEEILVSAAAAPFLERRFELESAAAGPGTSRLTGGERVGLPVGGRVAPLVGRHHELELLRGLLEVAREGSGRVVGVVGEAGIGKSRLVSEFRGGLFGAAVLCLETYCLSQGSSIPYFPVRGLVRLIFGLGETDDARVGGGEGECRRSSPGPAGGDRAPVAPSAAGCRRGRRGAGRADPGSPPGPHLRGAPPHRAPGQPADAAAPGGGGRPLDRPDLGGVPGQPGRGHLR